MQEDNAPRRIKPDKPAGCPLTPHPAGQWVAKVHGKLMYFGPWADLAGATRRYHETKAAVATGRPVDRVVDSEAAGGATVGDAIDLYLTTKKQAVEAKELAERTLREYHNDCRLISNEFGRGRLLATIGPADFARLRLALTQRLGPVRLTNVLQRIRSVFRFAYESEIIDRPLRFGPSFKKPPARLVRERRNAMGVRMYTAEQIRRLVAAAKPQIRAMILLGINAGYGATDVAQLPLASIDLAAGWIDFPRPKTAMPRRCPLWPETIDALQRVIAQRKPPHDAADAHLAFITRKTRQRYVRFTDGGGKVDGVAVEFRKLTSAMALPGRFYDLRRTHRTISDEVGDQVAAGAIMGHVAGAQDMGAVYRQVVSDERLRRVTDHVRTWLWPTTAKKKATPKAATRKKATRKKATTTTKKKATKRTATKRKKPAKGDKA